MAPDLELMLAKPAIERVDRTIDVLYRMLPNCEKRTNMLLFVMALPVSATEIEVILDASNHPPNLLDPNEDKSNRSSV